MKVYNNFLEKNASKGRKISKCYIDRKNETMKTQKLDVKSKIYVKINIIIEIKLFTIII